MKKRAKTQSTFPRPHAGQQQLLAMAGRYRVAVCGRRFGKTVAGAITSLRLCTSKNAVLVWWVTPTLAQSQRTERTIASWLKKLSAIDAKKWTHSRTEHSVTYKPTGSTIEFHTAAQPDNLRGEGLDLVIIDEAADIEQYTWDFVIRPMLIDRQGEALFLGTPRGTGNWLHELFLKGQCNAADYASIQLPTSANPAIEISELDAMRADMTDEQFRQEFDAEFIEGVNAVFKNVRACIGDFPLKTEPLKTARHITGVDLGLRKNWTVIVTIDTFSKRVVAFKRIQKTNWKNIIDTIDEHLKRFRGPLVIDSTGVGDPITEALYARHTNTFPVTITEGMRDNLIYGLALALARTAITYPHIPELVAELEAFVYRENALGTFRACAAPGAHDDCVFALALAWYGFSLHSGTRRGFVGGMFG